MSGDGLQLNDPQTLYRRWEDSQWSPFAVDLARDREQWPAIAAHCSRSGPRSTANGLHCESSQRR